MVILIALGITVRVLLLNPLKNGENMGGTIMSYKKLKEYACVWYEAMRFEAKYKNHKNAVYYIGHTFYQVLCYLLRKSL